MRTMGTFHFDNVNRWGADHISIHSNFIHTQTSYVPSQISQYGLTSLRLPWYCVAGGLSELACRGQSSVSCRSKTSQMSQKSRGGGPWVFGSRLDMDARREGICGYFKSMQQTLDPSCSCSQVLKLLFVLFHTAHSFVQIYGVHLHFMKTQLIKHK